MSINKWDLMSGVQRKPAIQAGKTPEIVIGRMYFSLM